MNTKKILTNLTAISLTMGLYACNIPYKIDVEQGHNITANELSRVSVGMTKTKVQLILGNPLLKDSFNKNRWDYVQYYISGKRKPKKENIISLYFKNNLLSNIDGQVIEIKKDKLEY